MRLANLCLGGIASLLPTLSFAHAKSQSQAQEPLQIYLYPTPTTSSLHQPKEAPTLTSSQAKAVLSHHLGEQLNDFDEIPNDESMWSHLMNLWDDSLEGKAKVVIIDGGVSSQDVLPTTLPQEPAFYLADDIYTNNLLSPYLQQAKSFLDSIMDELPEVVKGFKDVFEMAGTKAASILGQELSSLTALADAVPWLKQDHYPWEAITISGLKDVPKGEEVWENGRLGVKAGLESMTQPDSPPLLLIIRPSSAQRYLTSRALPPTLQSRANSSELADACYTSNETCSESTECNGRGVCALKAKNEKGECWGCKCRSGYAGVECQKDDYSTPFIILIFSSVLLVAVAVGSIGLLYTVGETKLPSTLTLAVGGGAMKRD
ncbi:uncharacterized protein I303_104465 [Kwoniella dejecticola CBS 10117]|uniref:Vacuolar sorting protein Vps3844 C-terminal domain-containing protein n=1 Tax=Kwoniella dejecticola CBS 10117 TaxID=1296121 RepID=A0A1A6A585_9TREE|nr:uncharacterized protein I303_04557 [Kwoniella dejecticola CBS 10117]OBR85224.1 hypothetical protein I303_04557 [Kwoniella dejecticola CBS 10117]